MAKTDVEDEPKKPEKKDSSSDDVELTEVTTQTAPAIKLPDGRIVGVEEFLVWMGNLVYQIKKNTG